MKRAKKQLDQYDEIMETCENHQQFLAKILTTMFSDEYIFTEKPFRKLLEDNPHGYVHVEKLLQFKMIDTFFKQSKIQAKKQQICMIRGAIESYCLQLYYHLGRIRRLKPFDLERYKDFKPICLQRISEDLNISEVRNYFGEHVFSTNRSSFISQDQDLLIYSLHYRQNMRSILKQSPPFQILDFEAYYKEYDLSFRLKQRRHKSLCRPLEAPKRRAQEFQKHYSRNKIGEQDDNFRYQKNYDYRLSERDDFEQFVKFGRQPNPSFNTLLKCIMPPERIQMQN